MHTFQTFCKNSYLLNFSRIEHFYKIKLLLEKPHSRKKWWLFCSHFDVLLCITDQIWACQDGWSFKRGSMWIYWGMGYINKIFSRNPQSADHCGNGQNLLIFLAIFSRANFHLIFLSNKSCLKTFKQLSINGFGWQRVPWVYSGINYGPWVASMEHYTALSGVP